MSFRISFQHAYLVIEVAQPVEAELEWSEQLPFVQHIAQPVESLHSCGQLCIRVERQRQQRDVRCRRLDTRASQVGAVAAEGIVDGLDGEDCRLAV